MTGIKRPNSDVSPEPSKVPWDAAPQRTVEECKDMMLEQQSKNPLVFLYELPKISIVRAHNLIVDSDCAICQHPMNLSQALTILHPSSNSNNMHSFHTMCFNKLNNPKCPLCNSDIASTDQILSTKESIYTLYLYLNEHERQFVSKPNATPPNVYNIRGGLNMTPFMHAILLGQRNAISHMIINNVHWGYKNFFGQTALTLSKYSKTITPELLFMSMTNYVQNNIYRLHSLSNQFRDMSEEFLEYAEGQPVQINIEQMESSYMLISNIMNNMNQSLSTIKGTTIKIETNGINNNQMLTIFLNRIFHTIQNEEEENDDDEESVDDDNTEHDDENL